MKNIKKWLIALGAFLVVGVIGFAVYSNQSGDLFKGSVNSTININSYKPIYNEPVMNKEQAQEAKQKLNSKIIMEPSYDMLYYYLFADSDMVNKQIIKFKPEDKLFEINIDKFRVAKGTDKFYLLLASDQSNKLTDTSYPTRNYHPYVKPEFNAYTKTFKIPIDYLIDRAPLTTIQTLFYIDLRQLERGNLYTIDIVNYNQKTQKEKLITSFKFTTSSSNSDILVPTGSTNSTKTINNSNSSTLIMPAKQQPTISTSNNQINTTKIPPLAMPK